MIEKSWLVVGNAASAGVLLHGTNLLNRIDPN